MGLKATLVNIRGKGGEINIPDFNSPEEAELEFLPFGGSLVHFLDRLDISVLRFDRGANEDS